MMHAINADIELSECFLKLNVRSTGNEKLRMVCIAQNYIVKVSFKYFEGFENRSEFFDRRDAEGINTPLLPNSKFFYPISYIPYHEFQHTLSEYELTSPFGQHTLWRFLSFQNFIEVYSTDIPVMEMIKRDHST